MTTGERIQRIRKAKGMTQKELGEKMPFEGKYADVRIAQYESRKRTPQEKILREFAKALNVDRKALVGPEGYEVDDVMRFLFELEDHGYKVTIRRRADQIVAEIFSELLNDPLTEWMKQMYLRRANKISDRDYLIWKFEWVFQ